MRRWRRPFTHEAVEEAFHPRGGGGLSPMRRWRRPFTHGRCQVKV